SKLFLLFYKTVIPLIILTSKIIFTVSDFSKKDIAKYYKVSEDRIHVIFNAVDDSFNYKCPQERNIDTAPFFLGVSSPNYHKNFERLIESFKIFNEGQSNKYKLKIIGSLNKSFKDKNDLNSCDYVNYLGRISDAELKELYSNASAFIFPSLYEGFGIPPLEAQACGCVVLSSNAASLPEVLADSAIFFNPTNIHDIVSAMNKFVSMSIEEKSELRTKAIDNLSRFSWRNSAKKVLDVITNIS
ncbi:TPA: glycosyltransferase family 4 protein, partial [Klebsiella pneumoniae]|nr:glycosyltransferase family 4 protein [Klebsiella pneumoniae]